MACGSALARRCPSCGAEAPATAQFCMSCGAELSVAQPAHARAAALERGEERRLVTVLFADLSGYTAVAERLDHETVKALVERCLTRLAHGVEWFAGHVD